MAIRSLFLQLVAGSPIEHEKNQLLREPTCTLHAREALSGRGAMQQARTLGAAHVLVHVAGRTPRLALRHPASGEEEERVLEERHAAFWVGDALEGAWLTGMEGGEEEEAALLVHCAAPMPSRGA